MRRSLKAGRGAPRVMTDVVIFNPPDSRQSERKYMKSCDQWLGSGSNIIYDTY